MTTSGRVIPRRLAHRRPLTALINASNAQQNRKDLEHHTSTAWTNVSSARENQIDRKEHIHTMTRDVNVLEARKCFKKRTPIASISGLNVRETEIQGRYNTR